MNNERCLEKKYELAVLLTATGDYVDAGLVSAELIRNKFNVEELLYAEKILDTIQDDEQDIAIEQLIERIKTLINELKD